jgi:glycosyltransferase involved in cell wall biosynthesis
VRREKDNASMRVLMVNYEFPPLGGGAGNATACIARELVKLGVEVTVLTSAFGDLPREEKDAGIRIYRTRVIRRRADRCTPVEMLTFLLSASVTALRRYREWKPDVSIAFFGIPSGPVAWLLKARHGVPYVVSLRGGDVPGFQPYELKTYHALTRPLIRFVWRRAAAVVANSEGLKTLARRTSPTLPIEVIPNGVDTELFHPRAESGQDRDDTHFLFVGRLTHQKGLDVLLKALASLRPNHAFNLSIAGDGPLRSELETLASELGIAGRITFLGWYSRDKLPDLYRSADVFVLPSRDEGMPNVILEAMASGLPVIATRIAGNEDLIRHQENGYLLPPDDPSALASALSAIAGDTGLRRRLTAHSTENACGVYSWTFAAMRYQRLMQVNMSEHKSAGKTRL